MSAFVLDASTTLAWTFEDEGGEGPMDALEALSGLQAIVPAMWAYETANALAVGQRRGRLSEAARTRFTTLLAALPIVQDEREPDVGRLVDAAVRHDVSAYDAAYLMLAQDLGIPLATGDGRLRRAAQRAGVELLG